MTVRHALGVVFIGLYLISPLTVRWYLFVHPCVEGVKRCSAKTLREMKLSGMYDGERECKEHGAQEFNDLMRSGEAKRLSILGIIWQCVPSDDPRLKEK